VRPRSMSDSEPTNQPVSWPDPSVAGAAPRSLSYSFGVADAELEPWTVPFALRRAVQFAPEHIALVDGTRPGSRRRWTYRELYDEVEALALRLAHDIEPGGRIAIWGGNHPAWLITDLAAAMAGLVVVPVNPAYRRGETLDIVNRTQPAMIVHASAHRDHDLRASVHAIAGEVRSVAFTAEFDEILPQRPRSRFGDDAPAPDSQAGRVGAGQTLPTVHPSDVAQIQFTSGTTGTPKGVLLHHRGLVGMSATAVRLMELEHPPTWLNVIPLFHIGGCGVSTFGPMTTFGTQVLAERFTVEGTLDLIESERVTVMGSVPTMLIDLLAHPERSHRDLTSLDVVMSGGAPVSPDLVQRIERELDVRFVVAFGQTESHGHITQTRRSDSTILKAETAGRPLPHVEVMIADPDSGSPVSTGVPGEVWTRSPFTMLAYLDDPAATRAIITANGFLRTGDLCTMDEDGYLRVVGRLKDQICRGGENISPGEIEEVLTAHPAVVQAAVVGLPDQRWGEIVAAFVRVDRDAPPIEQLEQWAGERLAAYKVPTRWFALDELPMTPSGKVQKHILRDAAPDIGQRWPSRHVDRTDQPGDRE
jgi:fatty-acyl-CoA synthase